MNQRSVIAGCALALILVTTGSAAARDCKRRTDPLGWYTPDVVALRSGGYLGFATVGLGYAVIEDIFNASVYYGWVPAALGGKDIHSLALAISLRGRVCIHRNWEWIAGYAGVGAVFTRGEGFFVVSPEQYVPGYYEPTGRRRFAFVGTELLYVPSSGPEWLSGHGAFVEVAALDEYLSAWWHNERRSFVETLSPALGYKARF